MSALSTTADGIKTVLEGAAALAGIGVIVDRQKNIVSKIQAAINKAGGNAVVIFFEGYDVTDSNAARRVRASYTVKTFSRPVIEEANVAAAEDRLYADDVIEIIHKTLQHYTPAIDGKAMPFAIGSMQVSGADFVPDQRWLCYELTVGVDVVL
jgi:hypothetical protein